MMSARTIYKRGARKRTQNCREVPNLHGGKDEGEPSKKKKKGRRGKNEYGIRSGGISLTIEEPRNRIFKPGLMGKETGITSAK